MSKSQAIKMFIGLSILGVVLFFALNFIINTPNKDPAKITVNFVPYKTEKVNINLPFVSGDDKISNLIDKKNAVWKTRANNGEIRGLNISTTYYDTNYISLLYSGTDLNNNKIVSSVVIDLVKRKEMSKSEIVDVVIKSKFEKDGKEDPKLQYPESTFNQFSYIYLEKGDDNTINGVFCWENSKSGKFNIDKLNGYEIIKSIS